MILNNDNQSVDMLFNTIMNFYRTNGNREVLIFESSEIRDNYEIGYFVRFLLEKKYVIEYKISSDRGYLLSILSLAIGPHFFTPGEFWDYKNSQRFMLEASTEAIELNLSLLDEFLRH